MLKQFKFKHIRTNQSQQNVISMIMNLTMAKMFRAYKFSTITVEEVQNPQTACESHLIVTTQVQAMISTISNSMQCKC